MDRTVSVAEAKNKLPSIIHEVEQGTTVKITRHGKSVAVVVRQRKYEQLMEKGQGFWKSFVKFRNLLSAEEITFTESDFFDLRDHMIGRPFSWDE